jgi:hypothetical protein
MSKKIGQYTESHLVDVAKNAVIKKTANTVVLDVEAEDRIPKFDRSGKCCCDHKREGVVKCTTRSAK